MEICVEGLQSDLERDPSHRFLDRFRQLHERHHSMNLRVIFNPVVTVVNKSSPTCIFLKVRVSGLKKNLHSIEGSNCCLCLVICIS